MVSINLISNLVEDSKLEELCTFNQVVAWSLRDAFIKQGVECRLVEDRNLDGGIIPEADYNIVISGIGMKLIRDNKKCLINLNSATRIKTALYLDADFGSWWKLFNYVFTVVEPQYRKNHYIYGGWGADPAFFYPEQDEKTIFLDSLMYNFYGGRFNKIYDIYKELFDIPTQVLTSGNRFTGTAPKVNAVIHMPIPTYDKRYLLIYWPEMQKIIRQCHYYCCTQLGESGLTRIESATCGALLVVPEALYRPKTMDSLEAKIWRTRDDLIEILSKDVNVEAIRKKALVHSWDKVASRIIKKLSDET